MYTCIPVYMMPFLCENQGNPCILGISEALCPTCADMCPKCYMHACIYVCMYTCVHACCIHVYMYACIHAYMYTCIQHACTHVYMHTYIHACM